MKRLLCILSNMNAGGAETFLMKLYRTLDKTKYQMDFCVNVKERCFYEDEIIEMGGKIYRIPSKSENAQAFKRQLTELIQKEAYEQVLRITSNAMGFWDLKIAKQAGAKRGVARSSNSSDGAGLKQKLAHRLGKLLYRKYVDVCIAPSDLAATYTFGKNAITKGRAHILHNAIDLSLFYFDTEKRASVRRELGIEEGRLVFGHIGRFMTQKNHGFLLDVFKTIKEKEPRALLLLVGKGELQEQLEQKAKDLDITDSVIFAGVRSDIPAVLSAMDVFVFPSLYEGMPNTVIEAQATGLPCVIADTITKEANITGLVQYLPLGSTEQWAEKAFAAVNLERKDTREDFLKHQYDIESATKEFVRLCFGE
ncbi:MAG: glycosyltransferase family 1 protein [Clostridia bacterium]|nr:glycosyltransferase family 1 protein [Clostridia bacterium]